MRDEVEFCELVEERLLAKQIDFMKTQSPDLWHRFADGVNWDGSLEGLYWVVSQPECDKATAALLFWKGLPTDHDYEDDDQLMGDDRYAVEPLLKYIAARFNTVGFNRSEIGYHFAQSHGLGRNDRQEPMYRTSRLDDIEGLVERLEDHPDALVKLHPDLMRLEWPGRWINPYASSEWDDSFPTFEQAEQELAERLGVVGQDLYRLPPFRRSELRGII
jgi:hypothetical protein